MSLSGETQNTLHFTTTHVVRPIFAIQGISHSEHFDPKNAAASGFSAFCSHSGWVQVVGTSLPAGNSCD
jgi:hypothetical protein